MASSSYLLLLAIILAFLSISGMAARPCKTLLISTYSLSVTPENPNLESDISSTRSITVFTIRRLNPHRVIPFFVNRHHRFLPSAVEKPQIHEDRPQLSFPFFDSFKDHTRDILSVVVALLFGVGCGALTAATMYLVWALVMNRHSYNFEEDDYESDESDDASLKKMGYVTIPAPMKEAA